MTDSQITLIDGDIVAYRAAFSCEEGTDIDAEEYIDDLLSYIMNATQFTENWDNVEVFLSGSNNFRKEVNTEYKANRTRPKPDLLPSCMTYLTEAYGAKVSDGQEADDDIVIRATELGYDETIIASIDKDFLQVPCWHYNFNRGTMVKVEEFEGLLFFYEQILTGDAADNVKGVRGIGPVKAKKLLKGALNERDMYEICLKAYKGDTEKVAENGKLLWLRRTEGEDWTPPQSKGGGT